MDIKIYPSLLSGNLRVPSSKSLAHRYLLASALADNTTDLSINNRSDDVNATISCLKELGATFSPTENGYTVSPALGNLPEDKPCLDVKESGSTLRFLLPVVCSLFSSAEFTGSGSIFRRPITDFITALKGVAFSSEVLPLTTHGKLTLNDFKISGKISSQYVSGLLFALPLLGGGKITVTDTVTSKPYITMTVSVLEKFGVSVIRKDNEFTVSGKYTAPRDTVFCGGDWSSASFFIVANRLGAKINLSNLYNDGQGDSAIEKYLDIIDNETSVDVKDIPDLVPVLSVYALFRNKRTEIINASRLRLKESDRLNAICVNLKKMGGNIEETQDGLIINGGSGLHGGAYTDSFGDHRIAMAVTLAGLFADQPTTLLSADAVKKSYPEFFNDTVRLGGKISVV